MRDSPSAALPATRCLSEDEVLAFAAGQLEPERRQAAHDHLDECDLCQQLLSEAVHGLGVAATEGGSVEEECGWSTLFRPGTIVGQRYLVRRFVARGGMGEVYEAFDRELQERVALKTVTSTACDDPGAVRRLKAEVQLARRVSHPSVCRIYDFGTHATNESGAQLAFLTMEFVDGITLGRRIRLEGALGVPEAVDIARQLLGGLKAAHDAGVLHRDFKSDNVMLRRDGDRFLPLILDFGLARALDAYREPSSSSRHGLVGTFAYIAPEQLEGKPNTTASDVYSFGVVLFEMLTGELPFKARSSPALTTLDRLRKSPLAPSSVNPQVPAYLDELVLACLRRSPEDRLATAAHVLARLDELEQRSPSRSRHAPWVIGAAALSVAVAYGLLLARVSERLPEVKRAARAAGESARVAEAAAPHRELAASLVSALPQAASPPAPATSPKAASQAARPIERDSPPPARTAARAAAVEPTPAPSTPLESALPSPTTGWENPFAPVPLTSAGADEQLDRLPPP